MCSVGFSKTFEADARLIANLIKKPNATNEIKTRMSVIIIVVGDAPTPGSKSPSRI
jgi:hypothetical protein